MVGDGARFFFVTQPYKRIDCILASDLHIVPEHHGLVL